MCAVSRGSASVGGAAVLTGRNALTMDTAWSWIRLCVAEGPATMVASVWIRLEVGLMLKAECCFTTGMNGVVFSLRLLPHGGSCIRHDPQTVTRTSPVRACANVDQLCHCCSVFTRPLCCRHLLPERA
jgi:hypothetical protein